ASGSNHKFTYAVLGIEFAIRGLQREPFVIVIVSAQDDVRPVSVEIVPEGLHLRGVTVLVAGAEKRNVPESENAGGVISLKVLAQPSFLGRTRFAASDLEALAIQRNDVPRADIKAVIRRVWGSGGGSKIVEIAGSSLRVMLMVAGCRAGARFIAAPGLLIAAELLL